MRPDFIRDVVLLKIACPDDFKEQISRLLRNAEIATFVSGPSFDNDYRKKIYLQLLTLIENPKSDFALEKSLELLENLCRPLKRM